MLTIWNLFKLSKPKKNVQHFQTCHNFKKTFQLVKTKHNIFNISNIVTTLKNKTLHTLKHFQNVLFCWTLQNLQHLHWSWMTNARTVSILKNQWSGSDLNCEHFQKIMTLRWRMLELPAFCLHCLWCSNVFEHSWMINSSPSIRDQWLLRTFFFGSCRSRASIRDQWLS